MIFHYFREFSSDDNIKLGKYMCRYNCYINTGTIVYEIYGIKPTFYTISASDYNFDDFRKQNLQNHIVSMRDNDIVVYNITTGQEKILRVADIAPRYNETLGTNGYNTISSNQFGIMCIQYTRYNNSGGVNDEIVKLSDLSGELEWKTSYFSLGCHLDHIVETKRFIYHLMFGQYDGYVNRYDKLTLATDEIFNQKYGHNNNLYQFGKYIYMQCGPDEFTQIDKNDNIKTLNPLILDAPKYNYTQRSVTGSNKYLCVVISNYITNSDLISYIFNHKLQLIRSIPAECKINDRFLLIKKSTEQIVYNIINLQKIYQNTLHKHILRLFT